MRIALFLEDLHQLSALLDGVTPLGYGIRAFNTARDLVRGLTQEDFDLVVLGSPVEPRVSIPVTASLVRAVQTVPVLQVVSDGWQESIAHMDEAPDDFMVWPVRINELRARIQTLVRRREAVREVSMVQHHGCYTVDSALKVIRRDGIAVELRPREYELGRFMFRNMGKIVPRPHLLLAVWKTNASVETRSVDTHMWRLRATLGLDGRNGYRLGAVYNRGYRLGPADKAPP